MLMAINTITQVKTTTQELKQRQPRVLHRNNKKCEMSPSLHLLADAERGAQIHKHGRCECVDRMTGGGGSGPGYGGGGVSSSALSLGKEVLLCLFGASSVSGVSEP
ncbi:hypothetical protein ACTXT7_013980 [Hymenolepis weldensis]